jgi:hypothetical protein
LRLQSEPTTAPRTSQEAKNPLRSGLSEYRHGIRTRTTGNDEPVDRTVAAVVGDCVTSLLLPDAREYICSDAG